MRPFRIRDPIHGFVELEEERPALDVAWMQRLREIKQLAMTHLVYPGTQHTRFEHSLGVCHIAGRMARELELPDDERRIVRAGALLHDVGHGPFSHVSENVLDDRSGARGVHEAISVAVIRTDPQLRAALGDETCEGPPSCSRTPGAGSGRCKATSSAAPPMRTSSTICSGTPTSLA